MEVESKYIVRRSGAFSAVLAATVMDRYRLEPLASEQIRDTYLDTEAGDLLSQAYVLRIRKHNDYTQATLKSLGGAEGPLHRRIEIESIIDRALDEEGRLDLPDGPLKEVLDRLIGGNALFPLLHLRQYRSPRVVFDGNRLVGVLSLDVIATETEIGPDVSHQIEVELAKDGREADIYRLDPILKEKGMEPADTSKFERSLILLQRNPSTPIRLLPNERAVLQRYQEKGTPLFRRRARVVFLSARGLNPLTVASKVGLSLRRTEHWIDAFRRQRMAIFEDATTDRGGPAGRSGARLYRISELLSSGLPGPELFPIDRSVEQSWSGLGDAHDPAPSIPTDVDRGSPHAPHDIGRERGNAPSEIVRHESLESEHRATDPTDAMSMGDGSGGQHPVLAMTQPVSTPQSFAFTQDAGALVHPVATTEDPTPLPSLATEARNEEYVVVEQEPISEAITVDPDPESISPENDAAKLTSAEESAILIPDRPVLGAEDTVLSAAERVLRYQYAWQADAVNRAKVSSEDPRSIQRLLISVHRLRIALQLFDDYLPTRSVLRLHRGLRGMARALDVLSDLDHSIAHVELARGEANSDEAPALGVVVDSLNAERQAAWKAVHVRLKNATYTQWMRRFERLLDQLALQVDEGVQVDDFTPKQPDNYLDNQAALPRRTRLQHMLGSAVWRRYESLRAFDSTVGPTTADLLHPLGVACAAMQFVLALTNGCSDVSVRDVSQPLARIESRLAVLHHARLTANALKAFVEVAGVASLHDSLREVQSEVIAEAIEMWGELIDPVYRQSLARVVASL